MDKLRVCFVETNEGCRTLYKDATEDRQWDVNVLSNYRDVDPSMYDVLVCDVNYGNLDEFRRFAKRADGADIIATTTMFEDDVFELQGTLSRPVFRKAFKIEELLDYIENRDAVGVV